MDSLLSTEAEVGLHRGDCYICALYALYAPSESAWKLAFRVAGFLELHAAFLTESAHTLPYTVLRGGNSGLGNWLKCAN